MTTQTTKSTIGVCSWSLQPGNVADLIASMQHIGVRACQLALVPLVQNEGHRWRNPVGSLQSAGIEVLSGMLAMVGEDYSTLDTIRETGGVASEEHWPANLELADIVAGFAADHGIGLVTFHAGFIPHEADDQRRQILLDRVDQIAEPFEKRGVSIALETGQETADTLLGALADLRSTNIGINFDPANMILYGMGDPIEALTKLAPHVMQIHIKDATPSDTPGEWGTEVPVGRGSVDFDAFFKLVADLPSPVNLVVEREAGHLREDDVATAVRMAEKHLSSA